jgi:hypothetical protein
MRGRSVAGLSLALALALAAGPAWAGLRTVEAVGVVAVDPAAPSRRPPRDAALHAALAQAVWQVAVDQLPRFDAERDGPALEAALGKDPLEYATRFRIVEDRGEQPALLSEDPEVEREYVVVIETRVDADRVREQLVASGLLARPSGERRRQQVRVEIEDVQGYGSYRAVQTLIEELGVDSAVPTELERGRAVLLVTGTRSADQLLEALQRSAPPNLSLLPLASEPGLLRLRARFEAPATLPAPAPAADPGAIDTP